jgi:ketosteroid isomerase-like protein
MAEQRAAADRMEVVRSWVDIAPQGDWVTALSDEERVARMGAVLEELATADIEVAGIASDGTMLTTSFHGVAGLLDFWQDWLTPWESFRVEIERVLEGPDGVVVEVVQKGQLKGSTALVETPSAAVHYFRDGRFSRIEFHLDRDRARRAAGL